MQQEEVVYLYLDDIIPNRFQPREVFDERPLKELAVSIKEHGVIQPIIVRKVNDKYEIIAGERRYKASALAGLTKIPAIIRDLDDKETSKVALLENLQRKNLNPLEEARTYQKILEIDEMTQEELAKTMGKSQSAVSNKLRLLSLCDEVQQALLKEEISERHARALLSVENTEEQKQLLKEITENKMTVRQLEAKIKGEDPQSIQQDEKFSISKDNSDIGSSTNFLNNSPLIPNFDLNNNEEKNEPLIINSTQEENSLTPQSESNIEPLITMPINQEKDISNSDESLGIISKKEDSLIMSNQNTEINKYINFGEIDDDDDNDNDNDNEKFYKEIENKTSISFGEGPISTNSAINLDDLKQNAKDINLKDENEQSADLDSLLRINNADFTIDNNNSVEDNSFKFFSPAAEAIKDSDNKDIPKSNEDYFKAPDIMGIDLPGEVATYNTNNVPLSSDSNNKKIEITSTNLNQLLEEAKEILSNALSKIEDLGIKVEKDEINLEKSYQVIIKLEKNN